MRTETGTGYIRVFGFFMSDGMDAREKRQHLFASLYQEHLELARIIGDLHFDADLDLDEVDHEIQCAHVRMAFLKSMRERLLLAGVTR
tara:strand:+ start:5989 stop:6252 length:264 start_codon:yes stop_codon:yes gene_type:complete